MEPRTFKSKGYKPEEVIQRSIIAKLRMEGWFVKETHGDAYQSGFPDLFATHSKFGPRWIEVKLPEMKGSRFTAAQLEDFPKFCANGSGVWILTSDTQEEYLKLFQKPNWIYYLSVWSK